MRGRTQGPIDLRVGKNIRAERLRRGWSQEKLAGALGVSYQQIQKYEKGTNRVAGGRLHQVAEVLKVSVSALFRETDGERAGVSLDQNADWIADPQVLRVARALTSIADESLKRALVTLIESFAFAQQT